MKRYLLILLISLSYQMSFGQVVPPQGITYQAVIIDRSVKELPGQDITERYYSNVDMIVKFSILESQTGPTEYEETHVTKTDAYGLLNLIIGQGTPIGKNFNTIDWGKTAKWLKVEIDFNKKGTFELFSLEKMWSVPYALYSQRSAIADSVKGGLGILKEKDGDTLNEIQTLKVNGDSISISNGNTIKITHPDNWDNDSINEIQILSRIKDSVFISKGNGIDLSDLRDKDIDTTNELQDLYLDNDSLGLTKSGKKISVSSLVTNNNGTNNSLNQYFVQRPCHQVKSSFSLDNIFPSSINSNLNLIISKSSYHLFRLEDTIYLLKDTSLLKKFTIDAILISAYLFEDHFFLYVDNTVISTHVYPGKTINDQFYVIKLDTLANYKWHTAISSVGYGNSVRYFAGNFFITSTGSSVYNTVDLKTGNKYSITLSGGAPYKITPLGFCQKNNALISYTGTSVGTSNYSKIPTNYTAPAYDSYYFDQVGNNHKYYGRDTISLRHDLALVNRKLAKNGIQGQIFDYVAPANGLNGFDSYYGSSWDYNPGSVHLFDKNGKLFIITPESDLSTRKLIFDSPSRSISYDQRILLIEDSNNYFVPKFVFHYRWEVPVNISSDGTRNNLLLRVDDSSACINGTVKNGKWLLLSF
jgi:hypothetical protein